MPRGRGRASDSGMGQWVESLGEQIGAQLGHIIAESVQRTLEGAIDVRALARKLGAGATGRRGRRALSGERAICREPGCGNAVLAKGLCRSHYYRARYRAQKAGSRGRKGRRAAQPAEATT